MTARSLAAPRFLRKTTLADHEYRRNFRQIDNDVIEVITSPEADAITPLMSKIYLKLLKAPDKHLESPGVLRFEEEIREGRRRTAWQVLCERLSVSSSTANKAIKWMAEVGIIGYFSGKNGVGLRIFLNRASSSIGLRPPSAEKKILPFSPAPSGEIRASFDEAGFNGTHAEENLEQDNSSKTPDGETNQRLSENKPSGTLQLAGLETKQTAKTDRLLSEPTDKTQPGSVSSILALLKPHLEATIQSAARQAASREHDKTREWLEKFGLPKVARVAQRESYNILRKSGLTLNSSNRYKAQLQVGSSPRSPHVPTPLSTTEITETVEYCIFRLQADGQSIDVTLAGISSAAGGYLLPEDASTVRKLAETRARILQSEADT